MSYLGITRAVCEGFLYHLPHPNILEIGVFQGYSMLAYTQNLTAAHKKFTWVGVDVLVRPEVMASLVQLKNIALTEGGDGDGEIFLVEQNSLNFLADQAGHTPCNQYDLILLDGDHNYHTVSQELEFLKNMVPEHGIIIVDDYNGRWSTRDLYYSENDEYEKVDIATPRQKTIKTGVQPAVDDFLAANKNWGCMRLRGVEFVMLYQHDFIDLALPAADNGSGAMRDQVLRVISPSQKTEA